MSNLDQTEVLPSPPEDDDDESIDRGFTEGRRWMPRRRTLLINGVIGVALLVVVALIVWTVRDSGNEPVSAAQTVTVDTGDVTASVSANGNVAAGTAVNLDFQGTGGVVTKILVKPGSKVTKGQVLATVDATSAEQALANARVQLESAQAGYSIAVQGQTSAEYQRDERSIDQARASVASARSSLRSAQDSLALTRKQQNAAVERAQHDVDTAQDAAARAAAKTALTLAKEARASALLQGRQQVASAQQQVRSANASLASTKATVAVSRQGATAGTVAQAQAQVDSAQIAVDEAQTALNQTKLRAPMRGRVAQVNGTVGESSTAGTSSSSTTATSTSTTDTSGFVVLTETDALQVTADVAEADIAEVKVGQTATVTLSASGQQIAGKVTTVDAIETVTNNVVEYGVTVTLDESKDVKLGQSTQVVITTGSKPGVLRVSSSALTTIGQMTTASVQDDDGTTQTVEVVTGLEGDGYTEVLSGLTEGDLVELPEQSGTGTDFTFPGGGGFGGGLP